MRKVFYFTLVEVIAAMAIMALALTAFFTLSQSAVNRITKAYDQWERMHLLSQAAEYCLLFPDEEPPDMPPEIFESSRYDIIIYYDDVEDLSDVYSELSDLENQAPLRTLVLELVDKMSRQTVDSLRIDRINYDSSAGEAGK